MWFRNLKYSHFPLETAIIMEAESFLFVYYLFFFLAIQTLPTLCQPPYIFHSYDTVPLFTDECYVIWWLCPVCRCERKLQYSRHLCGYLSAIIFLPVFLSLSVSYFRFAFYKKRKLALLRGFNSAITLCLPTVENWKRKSIVSEDTTAEKCNRWIHVQISYIGLCVFRTRV